MPKSTINNSGGGDRVTVEDVSFIGNKVVDPDDPQDTPQCYRALILGGTYGMMVMRRVLFAGVYAKGAVCYMGNGATNGVVDECQFLGNIAFSDDVGVDPQSLIEAKEKIKKGISISHSLGEHQQLFPNRAYWSIKYYCLPEK